MHSSSRRPPVSCFFGFLLLAALLPAAAAPPRRSSNLDRRITYFELDEGNVFHIPVSTRAVTTISFPSEIEGLEGRNIAQKGADAAFSLSYTPKNYYFSVAANQSEARTNLNVIWADKTYVLELFDSPEPLYSVVFLVPPDRTRPAPVTPTRLLGLLDKVKAFPLLASSFPRDFQDVSVVTPKKVVDFGDFAVSMEKTYRFDRDDTLVFEINLINKTDRQITYEPQGFAVRVGNNVYNQSISDASGVLPPRSTQPAIFAVTGTPDGQRNELSLKNDFTVIVAQTEAVVPVAPPPARRYERQGEGKNPVQ